VKKVWQTVALLLAAIIGLWSLGHGIGLAVAMRAMPGEHTEIFLQLVEASVAIAGGVCVLSVTVRQYYCWRTHGKDGGLV
jgi:hypothetical protein